MMKAIRFHGKQDVRLEDCEVPTCQPDEVKLKTTFCGICGSDLHEYFQEVKYMPTEEHPLTGVKIPCFWGHEFAGTIVEVGQQFKGKLKEGQHVAVRPNITCMQCRPCERKQYHLCAKVGVYGFSMPQGAGLCQYSCIKAENCYPMPESLPLETGALVEPLSVGWHAVKLSEIQAGQTALVAGAGPIGSITIRCLKARGVNDIVCVEPVAARAEGAKQAGASLVLNPLKDDIVKIIRDKYPDGIDICFDAAGSAKGQVINKCIQVVARKGTIVIIALYEQEPTIDISFALWAELRLQLSFGYTPEDYSEVIEALGNGKLNYEGIVTAKMPLSKTKEALEELRSPGNNHIKILLQHD